MDRKKYPKNELGRDFVCGDLHGAYERLMDFMKFVHFDKTKDRMFSVGDLVDRGPENEKCLRLIDEPWFHAVRGNHEQLMSQFYDPSEGPYGSYWIQNGGAWGSSYGKQSDPDYYSDVGMEMRDLAKKTTELPLMMTVERQDGKFFHVIHAELASPSPITDEDLDNEDIFNDATKRQSMDGEFVLWGRYIFYSLYGKELTDNQRKIDEFLAGAEKMNMGAMFNDKLSHIYSGHTIMRRPTRFKGQTNLDTRAFSSFGALGDPWSSAPAPEPWTGLTVTEPLTDRFWTAKYTGVYEVKPIILA